MEETPKITIEIKDDQISWTSNMPMTTLLYCMEVVKHLILTEGVNNG